MKKEEQTSSPIKDPQSVLRPAQEQRPTQLRPAPDSPVSETATSIELHIGELVLHGFEASAGYVIGDALERELARLFSEQGLPPAMMQAAEIEYLKSSLSNLAPDVAAEEIGRRIAQSVYGGLSE